MFPIITEQTNSNLGQIALAAVTNNPPKMIDHQQQLINRIKQKQWNDRFTVQDQKANSSKKKLDIGINNSNKYLSLGIIAYKRGSDDGTKRLVKTSNLKKRGFVELEDTQKETQTINKQKYDRRIWSKKKNELIAERLEFDSARNNLKLTGLVKQLQKLWYIQKIPDFHSYYYFRSVKGFTPNILQQHILTQMRLVRNKNSPVHEVMNWIQARQLCLIQIKKCLDNLQIIKIKQQNLVGLSENVLKKQKILKQQIAHYRKITYYVIYKIYTWRQYLTNLQNSIPNRSPQHKPQLFIFYHPDTNYLIKILQDTYFFAQSFLASFLNISSKNDPFLLKPLTTIKNQSNSSYYDLFQVFETQDFAKTKINWGIQYLAFQKTQQFKQKVTPIKLDISEKIYRPSTTYQPRKNIINDPINLTNQTKFQRSQKNQIKIKNIKGIYEPQTYSNTKLSQYKRMSPKKNKPESITRSISTGNTLRTDLKKNKLWEYQKRLYQENDGIITQFDTMLKKKQQQIQKRKSKQRISNLAAQYGSNNLIDKDYKKIQDENTNKYKKNTQKNLGRENLIFNQNKQIVKQLKQQIIKKIEKDIPNLRQSRRQQQQKIIDQLKLKMKRDLQQKITVEKRKKLLEKQVLQKKIQQQKQKLSNQNQLQLLLQARLNQQKKNSEKQKIKLNFSLKQKQLQDQIQKQLKKLSQDKQDEQDRKNEKIKLLDTIQKLNKSKNPLDQQLKKQLMQRIVKDTKVGLQGNIKKKVQQLNQQLKVLKIKQALELQKLTKQNQIKQKIMKNYTKQEQKKKNQIQGILKETIQRQKKSWQNKNIEVMQQQYRQNLKGRLKQINNQANQLQQQQSSIKRKKQIQQQSYRMMIKQKIQKQMRMQIIEKTQKQLQQRQKNRRQNLQKSRYDSPEKISQALQNKSKIQNEVKKQIIQKGFSEKKLERQYAKKKLRQAFQKQLLANNLPEYLHKTDDFLVKNINAYKQKVYLNLLQQQKKYNQTNLSSSDPILFPKVPLVHQLQNSNVSSKQLQKSKTPSKLNQNTSSQNNLGMNQQNYQIYIKKKKGLQEVAQQQESQKIQKSNQQEYQEQFKLIRIKNQQNNSNKKKMQNNKTKKMKLQKKLDSQSSQVSESSQQQKFNKKNKSNNNKKIADQKNLRKKQILQQSQEQYAKKQINLKYNKKNQTNKQQQISEKNKKKTPLTSRDKKKQHQSENKQKFIMDKISSDDGQNTDKIIDKKNINKNKKKVDPSHINNKPYQIVYQEQYTVEKFNQKIIESQNKKLNKGREVSNTKKQENNQFFIQIQVVKESQLTQYLHKHFEKISKKQLKILNLTVDQLEKKLTEEINFTLLIGRRRQRKIKNRQQDLVGLIIMYHERNQLNSRKISLAHFGSYKDQDFSQFILQTSKFIFLKDPCDQIQFRTKFNQQQNSNFLLQFSDFFSNYAEIYQKKLINTTYQRKYIIKRPFNIKCQVFLGSINKISIANLLSLQATLIFSNKQLQKNKTQNILRQVLAPQTEVSYSLMLAEIFRHCLTADEAQILKSKVKQYLKLKQLLILVVLLQKKKVKLDQLLKLTQYKSITQLNMRLMSQGRELIKTVKDVGEQNRIFCCQLNQQYKLPFQIQTATLPLDSQKFINHTSYFRLAVLNPQKTFLIKSSLYNTDMHILPTQNSKHKLLIMQGIQFHQLISQHTNIDLFMYIRLFLKNIRNHNLSNWQYMWLPQFQSQAGWQLRQFRPFIDKDMNFTDSLNFAYKQFIPGSLIIKPNHKDIVIMPPFVIGLLSMSLQTVSQGSPIYLRMVQKEDLKILQKQQKIGFFGKI